MVDAKEVGTDMSEVPYGMSSPIQLKAPTAPSELLPTTRSVLRSFARRRAWLQVCRGIAMGLTVLVIAMLLLAAIDHFIRPGNIIRALLSLVAYAGAGWFAYRSGIASALNSNDADVANSFELAQQQMRGQVLSAVELAEVEHLNGSPDFRCRLQTNVASQMVGVEVRRLLPWKMIGQTIAIACGLFLVVGLLSLIPNLQMARRLARVFVPVAPIQRASLAKIHLLQPDPATGMVAEGDLVGVMVQVERLGKSEVWLETRGEFGFNRQRMVHRIDDDLMDDVAPAGESDSKQRANYAANLAIEQTPVDYRIVAGDAETLWNTLTPRPRPRAIKFEKEYQFPAHTKLPNRTVTETHGDLNAFVGTKALMTVTFDQPVRDAKVLFTTRGSGMDLQPVSSDNQEFQISLPISTPGSFRVDAIAKESGLNNPFSPRYTIDPIVDRSPIASWNDSSPRRQIASPAAVISLSGEVEDDMPMDYAIQQIVLEGEGIVENRLAISPALSSAPIDVQWDLARFDGRKSSDAKLPSGSRLRTRLIAVDRSGHRGQSDWIDVYIAQSNFDPARHQSLKKQQSLTQQIVPWLDELLQLNEEIRINIDKGLQTPDANSAGLDDETERQLQELASRWESISGWDESGDEIAATDGATSIRQILAEVSDPITIDQWARVISAANHAFAQSQANVSAWQSLSKLSSTSDAANQRKRVWSTFGAQPKNLSRLTKQTSDAVQAMLAIELAVGLSKDLQTIQSTSELLADPSAGIPLIRLPGQSELLVQQLRQVSGLLKEFENDVPEQVSRHHEQIHRFVDQKTQLINDARDQLRTSQDGNAEKPFRETMRQIAAEIQSLRIHALLHGEAFRQVLTMTKETAAEPLAWTGLMRRLARVDKQQTDAKRRIEQLTERGDSNELAEAKSFENVYGEHYETLTTSMLQRLETLKFAEEQRADSKVTIVSDLDLILRSLREVTSEGFRVPDSLQVDQNVFFDRLTKAIMTLDAGNLIQRSSRQLQYVADRERYARGEADTVIQQPIRMEHIQTANEVPMAQIRHIGMEPKTADRLQATRWDANASQARDRLNRRRWANEIPVSAAIPIESLVAVYQSTSSEVDTLMEEARLFLKSIAPSLADQAREAAVEAQQQSQAIQEDQSENPDAPAEVAEAAEEEFETLKAQVTDIAEQLANRANNADYSSAEESQIAKDADTAIAAMQQQSEAIAKELSENAPDQASESLQDLAQTLEAVADHFEAVDSGEDAAQTRDALDQLAKLEMPDAAMNSSFDAAESVAQANQMTPEQLLKQLEKKLPTDDTMQESLQNITEQTVQAAEQMIREAANEETDLRRNLERSDAEFSERKRVARDELRSLMDRANAVQNHLLDVAESASGWANEPATRKEIQDVRSQLDNATRAAAQSQNEQALLDDLQTANETLREAVQASAEQTAKLEARARRMQQNSLHNSENSRAKAARQLESMQRRNKNEYLQSLQRETQAWRRSADEAGRRIQQAQNQERNARNQLNRAESQLKKHPDEAWAKQDVANRQTQVDEAKMAAEAAKQTRDVARAAEEKSKARYEDARNRAVANLDAANPAAELLARATQQAAEELQSIAESLQSNQKSLAMADTLSPPDSSKEPFTTRQERLQDSVAMAAEELRRAARHEQRLGNDTSSTELSEIADDLEEINQESMNRSRDSLRSGRASQANEQLAQAADQLRQRADALARQSQQQSSSDSSESSSSQAASSEGPSQKLAKTLDELDRAINAPPPEMQEGSSSNQQSPEGDSQSADSQDQTDTSQSGQSEGESGQPSAEGESQSGGDSQSQSIQSTQMSSGQASSTLAEAAEQAIRNLAQQRRQQVQQIAQAGMPTTNGEQASAEKMADQANNPALGEGQNRDNSLIDASQWNIVDGDWGSLREQQTEEVIQDRKVRIPLTYRRAVQAYFEAVSAESSKSKSSAPRDKEADNESE